MTILEKSFPQKPLDAALNKLIFFKVITDKLEHCIDVFIPTFNKHLLARMAMKEN